MKSRPSITLIHILPRLVSFWSLAALLSACLGFFRPALFVPLLCLLLLSGTLFLWLKGRDNPLFPRGIPPLSLLLAALLAAGMGSWGFPFLLEQDAVHILSAIVQADRHYTAFFLAFVAGAFALPVLTWALSLPIPSRLRRGFFPHSSFFLPFLILSLVPCLVLIWTWTAVPERKWVIFLSLAAGAASLIAWVFRFNLSLILPEPPSPAFFALGGVMAGILVTVPSVQILFLPTVALLASQFQVDVYNVSFF